MMGTVLALGLLRVVVAGSEPFAMQPAGEVVGFSVDVWKAAAAGLDRDYELVRADSVAAALDAVAAGDADVAIGPISITARRAASVDFTQPYFEGSLAILAPAKTSALDRIKPFLTTAFFSGLGALIVVLVGVGALMWIAERRVNPDEFPRAWRKGLPEGLWMALVTMTTVGYGDRVPKSRMGRVVTGAWMLVSIVITSSLVAFVATAFTLSQIDQPAVTNIDALRGQPVAVVDGSTGAAFARARGGRTVPAPDLDAAVDAVLAGDAVAAVFDRPILRHYLNEHPSLALSISDASYQQHGYGFAVREGDVDLREQIDIAILRLREDGRIDAMAERWLGP